jgi:hypothetical protein
MSQRLRTPPCASTAPRRPSRPGPVSDREPPGRGRNAASVMPPAAGAAQRGCPSGLRVGDVQLAAVGAGQPPRDVQAKPKPAAAGVGGRRVQTRVPLEDPIAISRPDSGALILDGHHRVHAIPACGQHDRRCPRGVDGGVVEQVAEDAADRQRIHTDQQRPSNLDGDRMVGMGQPRGPARLLSEGGRVDQRPPSQARVPATQAGGGQQLVEEPPQLLTLLAGDAEQLLLLEGRQRLLVLLDGGQGAKQGRSAAGAARGRPRPAAPRRGRRAAVLAG